MKKYFSCFLILGTVFLLLLFSGCQEKTRLTVWSFNDELYKMINGQEDLSTYYTLAFPDIKIDYSVTPEDQFPKRLDPVLDSGRGAPDIFALDSTFVRRYVESGFLLDITGIHTDNRDKLLTYPVQVGSSEGKVYAMSWQANPGAMFYRRSLARKYLGTDNPQIVQTYFSDFGRFLNSARLIKTRSNGACAVIASYKDLQIPFFSARQDPWVIRDRFIIDSVLDYYLNFAKELYENRWEGRVDPYSPGWFAGMRGELKDENGKAVEIFSYFLPTWGYHDVLKKNAGNTDGDWAMIQGPIGWYQGGSWIAAWKGTSNPEGARQMIEWLTTDNEFLEAWALGTGGITANLAVVNKIKDSFEDTFLGGQNPYAEFAEMAKAVNGRLIQSYDEEIQAIYMEALNSFVKGEKSRQEAMDDFKAEVMAKFEVFSD
ncbi:MAG: ABC transporter substrate-binding protein [Treponema sp.]|jgi:ABC-type glycerol-3-phosphate transport system substrate-binding protein|nr:ABC transporter substrate-binding protein [Treponema sp.]